MLDFKNSFLYNRRVLFILIGGGAAKWLQLTDQKPNSVRENMALEKEWLQPMAVRFFPEEEIKAEKS